VGFLVKSQPKQTKQHIFHSTNKLLLSKRCPLYSLLQNLLPQSCKLAQLEEKITFGCHPTIALLLFKNVVLQFGQITIFIGYFFENTLFHLIAICCVCHSNYSQYVFFCCDFLVKQFEVWILSIDWMRGNYESFFDVGLCVMRNGLVGERIIEVLTHLNWTNYYKFVTKA
jgi:hypothetical protein